MKKFQVISILMFAMIGLQAQNEADALRLSQSYYQGTARSIAMGGAFGALGADFSALSTNPAGLGLYRSSEYSISPGFLFSKTESTYNGMFGDDWRAGLALNNMGMVLTNKANTDDKQSPWRYYQFAFGMNRTNSFNSSYLIQGDNPEHSKVDVYLDRVWDINPSDIENEAPFDLYPAWYVYLLDTITIDGLLYYDSPVPMGGIRQKESRTSRGSTNEWLFAGAANLNDRVFFGATLGLPYTRYFTESTYSEQDIADTIPGFDYWNFTENLETRGWGINLKLGVIAWPLDWLRVGVAFHTPTYFYGLQDTWYTSTDAKLGPDYNRRRSPTGEYEYGVLTPLRALGSAAIIVGNFGSFSVDYEYVDYTNMRLRGISFRDDTYDFAAENDVIRDVFAAAHNIRMGTEWRLANFMWRAGLALYDSPYASKSGDWFSRALQAENGGRTVLSAGVGYSGRHFSIDLAWTRSIMNQDYYLYSYYNPTYDIRFETNPTEQKTISNSFVVSLRKRF